MDRMYMVVKGSNAYSIHFTKAEAMRWIMAKGLRNAGLEIIEC